MYKNEYTLRYPSDDVKVIWYPGGEVQARIEGEVLTSVRQATTINIDARIRSNNELMALLQLNNAIRGANPGVNVELYLPYLPYARADRRFVDGDSHCLQVFGEVIRTAGFYKIRTLDVHNSSAFYSKVGSVGTYNHPPYGLIERAIAEFAKRFDASSIDILFPDMGAAKRYSWLPGTFKGHQCFYAEKQRDAATGKLTGFEVPTMSGRPVLIIDDICDGGGTFIGIASDIHRRTQINHLGLYVTHGIFSKWMLELMNQFEYIYTTNSFHSLPLEPYGDRIVLYDAFAYMHG